MKIAQIASVAFSIPPRSHGGTEIAIDLLTRGLVARGHDVTLFASGDSRTTARLHSVIPVATQNDPSSTTYLEREYDVRNAAEAYRMAGHFDVLHSHWPTPAAYFSDRTQRPSVMTYAYIERHLHDYYRAAYPQLTGVCITEAQSRSLGGGLLVIPYGVDVASIPFGAAPGDFLITVGRLVPHKGADRAIAIARAAGLPLVIVGAVTPYLAESEPFWEERVRPHVDGAAVVHHAHLPNDDVLRLMSRARAFLFPISWDEPFGLVVAEAMAAGAPVIATPRGSLPELVEAGVTGFLGETDEELTAFVRRAGEIDRAACRRRAETLYSADRMVADYEALYRRLTR
ncbi:MAG TPA: glycosyltransferase family 4 protein [Thermoanaerobaculia bacterium]|jgi:glycosyltransferase involved in cell wall biosynthesis|nr:glycosyltransferase family 4 protein [Thermoanaerobaculia bacterium]